MSLLKKSLLITGSSYIALFCGLLQTMIISRALGPELMGKMSLVRQFALIAAQLGSLGLPMGTVYFINKLKYDPSVVVSTTLNFCNIASVISSIILSLVFYFNADYFGLLHYHIFIICSVYILFANARQVLHFYNIARVNAKKILIIDLLPVFVSFMPLGVAYLVSAKFTISMVLFYDLLLVPLFGFAIVYYITRKDIKIRYYLDFDYLKKALPYGLLINFADVLVVLNAGIALMLLRYYDADFSLLGYYSRGIRLAAIINISFASFLKILYSHWTNIDGEQRKKSVENVLNIFLYSALCICFVVYLFTEEMITVLFGREYLPAAGITRIILIGTFGNLIVQILQRLFIADGNTRFNIMFLILGLVSNFSFCFFLIPKYPIYGAAIGQVSGYIVMAITALFLAKFKYDITLLNIIKPSPSSFKRIINTIRKR